MGETFTDPFVLRDGSGRDLNTNMEVVLDIQHDYDLDNEDISEVLLFRAALIPKSWEDSFGDTIRKTAQEVADCIDALVDDKAKVTPTLRKIQKKQVWKPNKKKNAQKNKNKNKKKKKKKKMSGKKKKKKKKKK